MSANASVFPRTIALTPSIPPPQAFPRRWSKALYSWMHPHRNDFRIPIAMAYQPVVCVATGSIFAYEALVRTPHGGGAGEVLAKVNSRNRASFELCCRETALSGAARLGLHRTESALCININPNYAMSPETCIERTIEMAQELEYPLTSIILEVTEDERLRDPEKLNAKMRGYREQGIRVAIDDFGAGFAGLSLLATLEADIAKIDMELIRGIDSRKQNRSIVEAIVRMAGQNQVTVIAEGVETVEEAQTLMSLGVHLMQGYWFARPGFEVLPTVSESRTREVLGAAA